ncbi:DNA-(apurinic or apyrimidinic site) endonuclease isoform X1 [Juglans microcarpa x Juglans regia]|uniref:DNA-(apurinic or apyrimidinic site) endonuclease isoform X1 n=1 Tax=Juglans microcarpa x Juglans regia TaxID=2249226 RepID=UPI001B7D9F5F|nr:DNA-(apurinic or apyrimidinic site) endonuclease isoform X1 [Juglans microcarpa x Juglans regia]
MKRFFKPVEKDGPSKKPSLSSEKEDGENRDISGEDKREPLKFLTWNANSFLLRVKNNCPEFTKFVTSFDPDVIAIQEVRMPAGGSKGAPKNPGELKDDTSSAREEKQILMRALSSLPFANYRVWWSLADSKYAGTALLVKKCCQPKKVFFNLDKTASKHEPDGRVILAEFDNFRLLNTYVPNNGWKEEVNSFVRRRKWDKRILEFVLQSSDKPLVWCGDLNVSHEEIDVSHPEFFSAAKLNGYVPPNKEVDCGQPGFTLAERMRFGTILKEGKLIDAYRFLHKEKNMECGFSWSGHPIGKYRGKRMRIDYFIVSEQLKDRIVACEMHGQGIELEGFYGSDHCPVTLELSQGCFNSKHDEVSA